MSRRPSPIRQVLFRPCFAGSGLWVLFTGYAISSTQHPSAFIGYIIVPPIAVGRARADPALGLPAPRRTRGARRGYGRAFKERDLASGAGGSSNVIVPSTWPLLRQVASQTRPGQSRRRRRLAYMRG